jgi:putative transposase
LLTPKANGSYRFCVDYRSLNAVTKNLRWPIPNIENLLRRIGTKKAKYFATLDYTSGYHQAPLEEQSKIYTAFATIDGIYEFNRVPFGPKGAPAYFQKQM